MTATGYRPGSRARQPGSGRQSLWGRSTQLSTQLSWGYSLCLTVHPTPLRLFRCKGTGLACVAGPTSVYKPQAPQEPVAPVTAHSIVLSVATGSCLVRRVTTIREAQSWGAPLCHRCSRQSSRPSIPEALLFDITAGSPHQSGFQGNNPRSTLSFWERKGLCSPFTIRPPVSGDELSGDTLHLKSCRNTQV